MSDLSQDEVTVLLIAAAGEPLAPIGRWADPVHSLVKRGYLKPHCHGGDPTGHFNNYITDAGKAAAKAQDDHDFGAVIQANNAVARGREKVRADAERIAVALVKLAADSQALTGEPARDALKKWGKVILARAKELVG